MRKLFLSISIIVLSLSGVVKAQQLPLYTYLLTNRFIINPATIGSVRQPSIDLMARQQWLGFKNAPRDIFISYQAYVPKTHTGWGIALSGDQTASLSRNTLHLAYDYRLKLKKDLSMSIGLGAQIMQVGVNMDRIGTALDNNDVVLNRSGNSYTADLGVGVFVFNSKWNVGISTLQLTQTKLGLLENKVSDARNARHYYLLGGYNSKLNSKWVLRNMALVTASFRSPYTAEYLGQFRYKERIWFHVGGRSQGSALVGGGMGLDNGIRIGYTFETPSFSKGALPGTSHEINISYVFVNVKYKPKAVPGSTL
jgi:type IX secretion system PorP/SprF family membrane protein